MNHVHFMLAILLAAAFAVPAEPLPAADQRALSGKVLILAAASTTGAVEEIRREFARLHPAVTLRASYAASSMLARQIDAGAEAELFLSASREWAEFLAKRKLVARWRDLLTNELVVIVPADSPLGIRQPRDLASDKIRRLALADATSVPAGIYAKQALVKLDLWKLLAGKVTGAADVRHALRFVENGAAEAGIVYATDAAASKQVRIVARIEADLSEPICYPLVLLSRGSENPAAIALYGFMNSPAAAGVFERHGFGVLPPGQDNKPSE